MLYNTTKLMTHKVLDDLFFYLGDKLREMLLVQGSMDAVNLLVEREHLQECEEDTEGGWHTEGSLKLLPGWDTYLV